MAGVRGQSGFAPEHSIAVAAPATSDLPAVSLVLTAVDQLGVAVSDSVSPCYSMSVGTTLAGSAGEEWVSLVWNATVSDHQVGLRCPPERVRGSGRSYGVRGV